jgi:hypothetical protein
MVAMTKQMFSPKKQHKVSESVPELAYGDATNTGLRRRAFLVLSRAATVIARTALAGYKAIFDAGTA